MFKSKVLFLTLWFQSLGNTFKGNNSDMDLIASILFGTTRKGNPYLKRHQILFAPFCFHSADCGPYSSDIFFVILFYLSPASLHFVAFQFFLSFLSLHKVVYNVFFPSFFFLPRACYAWT